MSGAPAKGVYFFLEHTMCERGSSKGGLARLETYNVRAGSSKRDYFFLEHTMYERGSSKRGLLFLGAYNV